MKFTINKNITVKEEIEVDLPYYFKHDFHTDYTSNVVYGRITEDGVLEVTHTKYDNKDRFVYEIEFDENIDTSSFKKEYISSEKEFEYALNKLEDFIKKQTQSPLK
jgi:hypothetical protein